jgi:hypothetical protein
MPYSPTAFIEPASTHYVQSKKKATLNARNAVDASEITAGSLVYISDK